jgi:hypothetical protein
MRTFRRGDYIIYRKQKFSVRPSPHARDVYPTPNGDYYSYSVDKFWTVVAVEPGGQLRVCTRRGKELRLNPADPALRRPHWFFRLFFRSRFPVLAEDAARQNLSPKTV